MSDKLIANYTKLLLDFKSIPKIPKRRTFMEISGYPHYENVCSNILKFFLEPSIEHGLGDLMLKSLLQTIDKTIPSYLGSISVGREVPIENKRLDILIETNSYVIGIENKIFHFLNNDLKVYQKLINNRCSISNASKTPIYLVLSLNKIASADELQIIRDSEFVNITYKDWFLNIRNNIGKYLNSYNSNYTNYLIDFMKTIENLSPLTMENKELFNFFLKHGNEINGLRKSIDEHEKNLYKRLSFLRDEIVKEHSFSSDAGTPGVYEDKNVHCVYYNFTIKGHTITLDICISLKGWEIWLSAINRNNKEAEDFLFNEMLKDARLSVYAGTPPEMLFGRNRKIIDRVDISADLDADIHNVINKAAEILAAIDDYKKGVGNINSSQ